MLQSSIGSEKNPIAVGPWGGQSGSQWDDGVYSGVRQILLTYGAGIDSIQIEYDKRGSPVWSEKYGGTGGYKTEKVKLNYPEEFLTSIHGYHGSLHDGGPVCIKSLTFESNLRNYGPFGMEQGTYFSFPMNGHTVVGFYGRSGWYLDAIGAHLKPIKNSSSTPIGYYNSNINPVYPTGAGSGGSRYTHPYSEQVESMFPSHQKTIVCSQSFVATGAEKCGYSVLQGHIGNNYDVVFAI